MAQKKFYVVWVGKKRGVFSTWAECSAQVEGIKNARFKSFLSETEAQKAFIEGEKSLLPPSSNKPNLESICVDAACNAQNGDMEYKGIYLKTGEKIFLQGVFKKGTNNIGEFLAIVHALAHLKRTNSNLPIYSDSVTAIKWVKQKFHASKVIPCKENEPIQDLLKRAENWLATNSYTNEILKWDTDKWGENPADFGRK